MQKMASHHEKWKIKEEMLEFYTYTLTFLSFYDISSHPNMIQLITGFIVSTIYKLTVCKHWLILCGLRHENMQNTAIVHMCLWERVIEEGDEGKRVEGRYWK